MLPAVRNNRGRRVRHREKRIISATPKTLSGKRLRLRALWVGLAFGNALRGRQKALAD